MPIHQLPPNVVNQIAAGEVIERPASVVKELVENALDAGASRIDVSVEQGGLDLIRVVDDGCGIAADELPLAVASHATSKLSGADDLFRVATLGFRGEALASIAAVSRFLLRSHCGDQGGAELQVNAGQMSDVAPCGAAPGTTIEVRQLFYNTPVRRKFLRSTQTEMGHVAEAVTRLALAHPHVHFTLRHNNRVVHDLPPTGDLYGRIAAFFGPELADDLIPIDSADEQVRLSGYVARPNQSRSHNRMQYLFLNGRYIRDRALQHALGEAYRGLLTVGRYPITFLHFDMPPELVDVNVHPTKLEVRFQDGGRLYSQLLATLRTRFLTTDLTHRLEAVAPESGPAAAHDVAQAERLRQEMVDWAKGQLGRKLDDMPAPTGSYSAPSSVPRQPLELNRLDRAWRPAAVEEAEEPIPGDDDGPDLSNAPQWQPSDDGAVPAVQIHNRYLIAESEEGVLVIDQHALHERILYEQLRDKLERGGLEVQNLLVPEPVDLSPAEAAQVLQQRELLERLGVRVEPFGGDTVLVSSHPAMLKRMGPADALRTLLEPLLQQGREPNAADLVDELLHSIACKAAIKAGDRLTEEEIAALLRQRHLARDTHHCPHGRPTALVFTREELDKQFKRT